MGKKKAHPDLVRQLIEAIRASGQSLSQLGKTSGIDAGRLSRFVRGERNLSLEAAAKLCRTLHLELRSRRRSPTAKGDEKEEGGEE